jgi:hypothetical protein
MKTRKRQGPAVAATAGELRKIKGARGHPFDPGDPTDTDALISLRRIATVEARERLQQIDDKTAK